jgi:hypothetical protein
VDLFCQICCRYWKRKRRPGKGSATASQGMCDLLGLRVRMHERVHQPVGGESDRLTRLITLGTYSKEMPKGFKRKLVNRFNRSMPKFTRRS